jgi:hypothetical protein
MEKKQVEGRTVTVMVKDNLVDTLILDTATDVLRRSCQLLEHAHDVVCASGGLPDSAQGLAAKYFLTSGGNPAEMETIRDVIKATRGGLTGDVWLKVGEKVRGDFFGDTEGRVKNKVVHEAEFNTRKQESRTADKQLYESYALSRSPRDIDAPFRRWGAPQFKANILQDPQKGVLVFIHEATHKYAGTFDYAYFDDDGETTRWVDETFAPFRDPKLAAVNADSYAFFVTKLGALRGLR